MPAITDMMAHVFWYSQHMATVHQENGQYHVHLEFAAAAKKDAAEKNTSIKTGETTTFHLSALTTYHFSLVAPSLINFQHPSSPLAHHCGAVPYSPPKAI